MKGGPYPGLFLFTIAARVVRPVLQRATGRTEYIGPMVSPIWHNAHHCNVDETQCSYIFSPLIGATFHGHCMSS